MKTSKELKIFGLIFPISYFLSTASFAQIAPDPTLSAESSVVTPNLVINGMQSDRIDGGAKRGTNLFHSFQEFNIESGRGAHFTNPDQVTNILTRITGTNPSHINGTLGVLGNANLFFVNPNGIVFGPSARLQLNGSFLGSSASSINFADGNTFSATNLQTAPLLTVSVPVGLGLSSNSGAIRVQGRGHSLYVLDPTFSPFVGAGSSLTGLRVQPGKTLALVGGDVDLEGGTLTAVQGRIELGSVSSGVVSLSPSLSGWNLGYEGVQSFQDIRLSERALADTSGLGGGNIQFVGRRVMLTDGSIAGIQNRGFQPAGSISVNASESLEVVGTASDGSLASSIFNETLGTGNGGDIAISTKRLLVQDGGGIFTRTFSAASGGNLTVNASGLVQLTGFSIDNPSYRSSIATVTYSSGRGGDLTVSTERLIVLNGAFTAGAAFGTASGGDVMVNATESVELIGYEPSLFSPSTLGASTLNTGDAGKLTINTRRLVVRDGGRVDASTGASGDAGSVTINASESVDVSGTVPGSRNPSLVTSSANILDPAFQQLYRLPPVPSGASGDVTINTERLSVRDAGLISVRNDGSANAGTIRVNANSIVLENLGSITAATASGEGGNIFLQAQNLQLHHNAAITATAGGSGNGGNLTIDTGTLTALENSDITANAIQGSGGNIQISTQGIFRSADSDITASSELGISGAVQVTALSLDQQNALVAQAINLVSTQQIVAGSCLARRNAQQAVFIVTGNGGLPENPLDAIALPYELVEVQPVGSQESAVENRQSHPGSLATSRSWKLGDPIQPATDLLVTADGRTLLVEASTSTVANPQNLTCQRLFSHSLSD